MDIKVRGGRNSDEGSVDQRRTKPASAAAGVGDLRGTFKMDGSLRNIYCYAWLDDGDGSGGKGRGKGRNGGEESNVEESVSCLEDVEVSEKHARPKPYGRNL